MTATLTPAEPRTRPGAGFRGLAWLTWRQHRGFLVCAGIGTLVALGVALWFTNGLHDLVSSFDFHTFPIQGNSRLPLIMIPLGYAPNIYTSFVLIPLWYAPVLLTLVVAVVVGAPLVAREYEHETHLLAWSQGVTRSRWFLGKTGLLAAAAAVSALVLGFGASSVASAYRSIPKTVQANNHWEFQYFEASPLLIVGYTLFGLTLGLAVSALVRRTLPAMAITFAVFAGVRWVVAELRPYFLPPLRFLTQIDVNTHSYLPTTWGAPFEFDTSYIGYADVAGNKLGSLSSMDQVCPIPDGQLSDASFAQWWSSNVSCLRSHGVVNYLVEGQSANRLPTFQLIETGIFLVLAAALFVIAWRRVRARTTL